MRRYDRKRPVIVDEKRCGFCKKIFFDRKGNISMFCSKQCYVAAGNTFLEGFDGES